MSLYLSLHGAEVIRGPAGNSFVPLISLYPRKFAAAAAKSLQSCPALCDPIDSSPPDSRSWDSPGKNTGVGCHFLLQCVKVKSERVKLLNRVRLLVTPWTVAHQAPPSMGFSRREYWSGVPLPSLQGNLGKPNLKIWLDH